MSVELGKLEKVDIRKKWPQEELFSKWLKDNMQFISEKIGIVIEDIQLEQQVGKYYADILGKEEGTDNLIIIENQFGETDHDHLGKILTYMSGKNAKIGVWIAEKFTDEHIATLEYLNENISKDGPAFFGLEIRLLKIGNSDPALQVDIIVKPNEWQKELSREILSEADLKRHKMRLDFWTKLVDRYKEITPSWNKVNPQPSNWLGFGSGISGLTFNWAFKQEHGYRFAIELYIDVRNKDENKRIFFDLKNIKQDIEKEMGIQLDFQELPDNRASRIELARHTGKAFTGLSENDKSELVEWGAQNMLKFSKTLSKYVEDVV